MNHAKVNHQNNIPMLSPTHAQILVQNDHLKAVAGRFCAAASVDNFECLRRVTFEVEESLKWLDESSRDHLFIRECCSSIRGLGMATTDFKTGKRAAGFLMEDVLLALIKMLRCHMGTVRTAAQMYPPIEAPR